MATLNAMGRGRSDVSSLAYFSGEVIRAGDRIRYHGEQGYVDFVVTKDDIQPDFAWYLEQIPWWRSHDRSGRFGSVFLGLDDLDEDLQFVSRASVSG